MTKGVIAAGHQDTVAAGAEILRLGGNAFDGAIASMLTAFVVESALTSPGGGGFLLAHTAKRQNILFDFFSQTPRHKRLVEALEFYDLDINFGDAVQKFHVGLGAVAVPGALLGAVHVHQRLGRLPFSVVAEPAIHFARNGFTIGNYQAYCFHLLRPILLASKAGQRIYAPQGRLLQTGDHCTMTNFADTLEHFAKEGIDSFYHGDIARQIVRDCQEQGGYLTLDDLKHYRVIERSPLGITYRGKQLLTNPPPSSGGALIAFALKLLEQHDLSRIEFGSIEHRQLLAQVMHLTNLARKGHYDANIHDTNLIEEFFAPDHLERYHTQLNKWGSTTHISVLDSDGNAASITSSNGEGSGYVVPDTGIMLNNMLGEADLNPGGFHRWQENMRMSSMMAPTIVLDDGQPLIVLGSGGSNRIRTAILQVISNLLDYHQPILDAVDAPRMHWEDQWLNLEPPHDHLTFAPERLPEGTQILRWEASNMFFGGVHSVTRALEGAGDRRREGAWCAV